MNRTIDADVVLSVAFNSDGTKMLSSQYNSGRGSVTVYDAATGVAAVSIEPTPLGAVGVFSSDGSTILLTGEDGNIAVADVGNGFTAPDTPTAARGLQRSANPCCVEPRRRVGGSCSK